MHTQKTSVSRTTLNLSEKEKVHDILCEKYGLIHLEQLGRGAYGRVYQHPTDTKKVIKIAFDDAGYAKYLKWVIRHQNNPYVPRIFAAEFVRKDKNANSWNWKQAIVVVMEKLREAKTWNSTQTIRDFLRRGYGSESLKTRKTWDKLLEIYGWLQSNSTCIDLHSANVMMRGACQVVVTDPLAI